MVDQQATFDLPLMSLLGDGQEVEVVGVFQDLLREVGVGRRRCATFRIIWRSISALFGVVALHAGAERSVRGGSGSSDGSVSAHPAVLGGATLANTGCRDPLTQRFRGPQRKLISGMVKPWHSSSHPNHSTMNVSALHVESEALVDNPIWNSLATRHAHLAIARM
jgi:hypothetical protein